jgi:xylulokinase
MRLTGIPSMHHSAGPFFGIAYDLRNARFDEKILDSLGISRLLLPDIFSCEDIVGEVTDFAAGQCGLKPGTAVVAGQVDCNASWIGAGAIEEGDMQSNLGSVGNFGIVHQNWDFIFSDIGRLMINFPYTINSNQTLITVPTTLTGGHCLRFIRDNILDLDESRAGKSPLPSYDELTALAEKIPLGCEGLIALPFLMGERTPIWNNQARGVIFGLSLNHRLGHLVRAMMEAVAFAMYDSFRLIQASGMKMNYPLVMNEGGAISRLWRTIITDVFNVPTVMLNRRVGAPFGDAILAGVATGFISDFNVTRLWSDYVDPLEPDPENHLKYMEIFDIYKRLYEHVKDDFNDLARLR